MATRNDDLFSTGDPSLFDVQTTAAGASGALPFTDDMLRSRPSGDLFGWSQDAAMGWSAAEMGRPEFLILSTMGGLRAADGSPVALGYHTGHWEVGLLVEAAAREIKSRDVKIVKLEPRRPRYKQVLADGERMRQAFLQRLDKREEEEH